jgi:imidazolonepropionase-like amidohydrolase
LVLALAALAGADELVAVKVGRVIPVSGPELRDAVVLVKGGKIEAVGAGIEVPWNATVIEAPQGVLMPGLIEAHTSEGLDRPNENVPSVPFVSVLDALDPVSFYFEDALREGVTTLLVLPGHATMIGGRGLVVKPVGRTVEQMLVKPEAAIKLSLEPRPGTSRMSHLQRLRRIFQDLQEYLEAVKAGETPPGDPEPRPEERPPGEPPPPGREEEGQEEGAAGEKKEETHEPGKIDPRRQALVDLIEGRLAAHVWCPKAADVPVALELADRYHFRAVLVLGPEAWRAADVAARRKAPVILDPRLAFWEQDDETGQEDLRVPPAIFSKAGVKYALLSNPNAAGARSLLFQAATAVKHGVDRTEALQAVTLRPAEMLGLADRLGSIEKGKDATMILLTGDPFDYRSWVDRVFIDGQVVYERSKDTRLQKLMGKEKK